MKPHIILKLKDHVRADEVPHWGDIVTDKTQATERIRPSIDEVLKKHRTPVWVTREYKPASGAWSPEEVTSGLNRIYRLILNKDSRIPPDLIREISLLPEVEEVRMGRIGRAEGWYVGLQRSLSLAIETYIAISTDEIDGDKYLNRARFIVANATDPEIKRLFQQVVEHLYPSSG